MKDNAKREMREKRARNVVAGGGSDDDSSSSSAIVTIDSIGGLGVSAKKHSHAGKEKGVVSNKKSKKASSGSARKG